MKVETKLYMLTIVVTTIIAIIYIHNYKVVSDAKNAIEQEYIKLSVDYHEVVDSYIENLRHCSFRDTAIIYPNGKGFIISFDKPTKAETLIIENIELTKKLYGYYE